MPRFDVYPTPLLDDKPHTPYWLDVQADLLSTLATRVIVPLRRTSKSTPLKDRLNPSFVVQRAEVFADVANLGVFPTRLLRQPVANLREHRFEIENALDFLFSGQ